MLWIVIPVFLFLLTGCGGGGSNPITTPVGLSVSPTTATLAVGGVQIFTATVTGSTNKGVTWSVQEGAAGGAIDASGRYTAPSTIGTYHVVATSQADGTQASATINVQAGSIGLSVSPATGSLAVGGTQIFTATVTGSTNKGVTWSVQEGAAGGAIDANGKYTAPSTIGAYHVVATSQADGTQASATVSVPGGSATGTI